MTDRLQADDIVDGRYKIVSRLGSGGMADVYCAEDMQLGRKVALKMLYRRFAEDSEFVERFRREASSAAGLQHPNVVAVYDRGEEDGTQYIAMEYVEGRSLKDLIRADGALDAARAINLTEQVLRAARFAHKRGIVHRDLKPHNVIVSADDRAKVTDFGIARAGASDMTQTGSIMGTAQYLSPEQAQGQPVSPQSDLYSVGILLYELLTGSVPFDGESAVAIALQQVGAEPVPPSQLNPAITAELEKVVLHALEKDPADRPADAEEFLAELEAARASLPVSAETSATTPLSATTSWAPEPDDTASLPVVPAYVPGADSLAHYGVPTDAPGPVPEGDNSRRKWWLALVAVLVVAGLVVGGLLLFGTQTVSVPLVVGDAEAVAEQTLSDKGFSTDAQTKISDEPKGQVIAQSPLAGKKADKGSRVKLTISGGPGTAEIPVLGDKTRGVARSELEGLGFSVQERTQADPKVAKGHIVQTDPVAGEQAEKGSTVVLVVSSGPEMVSVPDVVGKTQSDAEAAIVAAGLVSKAETQESDKPAGTVLAQDKPANKDVVKDSTITITVAIEQTEFDVPNVVGKSQDDAVATLSGEGFKVVTTQKVVDDTTDVGMVLSQDPATGKLKKGKTVNIVVGQAAPATTSTSTTPTTTDEDSP